VYVHGASPLPLIHGGNRRIVRRPDAVVHHQGVDPPEGRDGVLDQRASRLRRVQVLREGSADGLTSTLGGQALCTVLGSPIVKRHACTSLTEEPYRRGTDASRTA